MIEEMKTIDLKASYNFSLLTRDQAASFERMTYPLYKNCLYRVSTDEKSPFIALGCRSNETPVGLALVQLFYNSHEGRLLSVFTDSAHRGKGIAAALIMRVEEKLKSTGINRFSVVYERGIKSYQQLESALKKCGFPKGDVNAYIGRSHTRLMRQSKWLRRDWPLTNFSLFPWKDISKDEVRKIKEQQKNSPWYPEILSPFNDPDIFEPITSVGLRNEKEVVGWSMTHRIAADTIRYTSLFVREEFQQYGLSIPLLADSIRRHEEFGEKIGIFKYTFIVYPDNENMLRFVKKRLGPYLDSLNESMKCVKPI